MVTTAIILAGAVAKGAFQAGVLQELDAAAVPIVRLVAASAGSLNAAVYAAGIRHGRTDVAVASLIRAWTDDAEWGDFLRPSLRSLLRGGLSSSGALGRIVLRGLQDVVPHPAERPPPTDVTLQMVVAPVNGKLSEVSVRAAIEGDTTFEHVMEFAGTSFDTDDGLRAVTHAVTASAAFPLLFAPVDIDPVGPCIDGGAVNNTPVSYALETPDVHRVIVVTDNPRRLPADADLRGVDIIGRLVEMLVNERLFRDLRSSEKANEKLRRIDVLAASWGLTVAQRAELREAIGWRPVELIQIRPDQPLAGTPFSGLHDRDLRKAYIAEGRRAAAEVLSKL